MNREVKASERGGVDQENDPMGVDHETARRLFWRRPSGTNKPTVPVAPCKRRHYCALVQCDETQYAIEGGEKVSCYPRRRPRKDFHWLLDLRCLASDNLTQQS